MTAIARPSALLKAHIVVRHPMLTVEVDLCAGPGDVIGLVGPNGAGKTTVLRAIAGLRAIDAGRIAINAVVMDDPEADVLVAPQHRRTGVVFQDYRLFPHLSALDNVAFGLVCTGTPRAQARNEASNWLDRLALASHAHHKPGALSGGQCQRVALARALVRRPTVLLLDEPLAAIDSESRRQIRDELSTFLTSFSGVTLVVSHNADDVKALADRVVVLEAGQATWQGPVGELAGE